MDGNIHTAWGISVTGVLIFNGLSGDQVDPFYPPTQYNGVRRPKVEKVDKCLAHP